jgi:transcriptional regulator with XRE-family HTH domain
MKLLEDLLDQKKAERSRVVGLYRRGRLTDTELDEQMEDIGREEAAVGIQVDELRNRVAGAQTVSTSVRTEEALLENLRRRLEEPVAWEQKRRLIEVLVAGIRIDTLESLGAKQSKTTVTYRFSEPNHPLPAVLPLSYPATPPFRFPTELNTIGDHIRRRRLEMKLLQREVAEQIGVDKTSVFNWEAGVSEPSFRLMPAIIRFLGYNPFPPAERMTDRLVLHRKSCGLSQVEFAGQIGVDPCTLAGWERGEREPKGELAQRVASFLQSSNDAEITV